MRCSAHSPRGSLKPEGLGDGLKHNTSLPPAHLLLMNRMNQNLQAGDFREFAVLPGGTGEQQAAATAAIAAFLAVVYALTKVVKAAPAASCQPPRLSTQVEAAGAARAGEALGEAPRCR